MEQSTIDRLIINRPYEEPQEYWRYNRERRTFSREHGRRPAGYLIASGDSRSFDDPGEFVEIPLVNKIRPRVQAWREAGYPGATSITKRLLEYWTDPEDYESRRFFFCQLEAAETLIWLTEGPAARESRARCSRRRRRVSAPLREDGYGDRQDGCHGDGYRVAHPE